MLPVLGLSPLEQRFQIVLDLPLKPCYNRHMKETQYTLHNPYTGELLVTCEASELTSFLSYFRGLIGVWDIPYEVIA